MKKFLYGLLVLFALIAGGVIGYVVHGAMSSAPTATTRTSQGTAQTDPGNGNCTANDLTAKVNPSSGGGAAGSRYYDVTLTNSSTTSCALEGYPGVSLTDATGTQVGNAADKDTATAVQPLTLAPNESVKSVIKLASSGAYPEGTCKDGVTTVKIFPPNETGYLSAPTDITTWCPGFTTAALTKS